MSGLRRRLPGLGGVAVATGLLAACAASDPSANLSTAQAQSTPLAAAPAALHAPSLKELTGLHQPEILALLGKPDLRRDEPPAELWQYRTSDCVLSLFFYRESDGYRLVRAEAWRRSLAGDATAAQCGDENAPARQRPSSAQSSL
jgi:hypothetical protein